MDVAQALSELTGEAAKSDDAPPQVPQVEAAPKDEPQDEPEAMPRLDVKSMIASWGVGNGTPAPISPTRRTSSYEKYSAFVLPPLVEEKTPVASPANTLPRNAVPPPNMTDELQTTTSPVEDEKEVVSPSLESVHPATLDAPESKTTSEQLNNDTPTPTSAPFELSPPFSVYSDVTYSHPDGVVKHAYPLGSLSLPWQPRTR